MGIGQDQQQHPSVLSGGLSRGGSMAMAVGVSDMQQVTGDMQHVTHDSYCKPQYNVLHHG